MVRFLGYILETAGWALVLFTVVWTLVSAYMLAGQASESASVWVSLSGPTSLIGYLLEGVILGLIGIIIGRFARHPSAPTVTTEITKMMRPPASREAKADD